MTQRKLFFLILVVLSSTTVFAGWFQDKQYFETESFGQVVFSHDLHFAALGQNCELCHNDVFNIVTKKNPAYTMAEMEKGKSCGACHNGRRAFSVTGDCTKCHSAGDIEWKSERLNTQFSHSVHLDAGFSCNECHPDLFKAKHGAQNMTMSAMEKGRYCGACHDGDTAFSLRECGACHTAGTIKWKKKEIGITRFSHSVHLDMGFSCDECHPDLFKAKFNGQNMTMSAMEKGRYCGACHDGDTAFSVTGNCATCHAGEISWTSEVSGKTDFSHSIHLDSGFSCGDCHPDLFKPQFKGQEMSMADMYKGEYCGACHDGDTAFSVKKDCTACHAGDLTWENKAIGDTHFSHSLHLDMGYSCSECHPDPFKPQHKGQDMTMDEMGRGKYCGVCHDGDTAFSVKRQCKTCHKR